MRISEFEKSKPLQLMLIVTSGVLALLELATIALWLLGAPVDAQFAWVWILAAALFIFICVRSIRIYRHLKADTSKGSATTD